MNIEKLKFLSKNELCLLNENTFKMYEGNKYNLEDLQFIIKYCCVTQYDILKTQILNIDFCKKFILDEKYSITDMDKYITKEDINYYQPHIDINSL